MLKGERREIKSRGEGERGKDRSVMGITERTGIMCVCLVAGLIYSEAIIPASSLSGADPTGRHYFTLHCGACSFFVLALHPH